MSLIKIKNTLIYKKNETEYLRLKFKATQLTLNIK